MAAGGDNIEEVFKKHKVVPDVINTAPKDFLTVTYDKDLLAENGVELTPTQVKAAPKLDWNADSSAFYTLIMTDPDAPSRKNPKFREYHHWLVVNIPGKDIDQGEVLTAYVGSGPPEGTGLHRYIFLVFKQTGKQKFTEERIQKNSGHNRGSFKTAAFAKKYKLGDPICGNLYQAQWDEYVPTVHRQLQGKK